MSANLARVLYSHRHDVVLTVNQVYAAMVASVIPAKSQPNLYVCLRVSKEFVDLTVFTAYQDATYERDLQCSRNNSEDDGLKNECNTSKIRLTMNLCKSEA